jgi:hypothetical protein
MQLKNIPIFTAAKWKNMPLFIYKSRVYIALLISLLLLFAGCNKNPITQKQNDLLAQYFEANILNRDYKVNLATDNGVDYTAQYNGIVFKMFKNTLTDGPMTAIKSGVTYNGTWSCNEDYSKLVITLPALPAEFVFLTREWKFTKKAVPVMELAPWGTLEPKVLYMERL